MLVITFSIQNYDENESKKVIYFMRHFLLVQYILKYFKLLLLKIAEIFQLKKYLKLKKKNKIKK